MTRKIKVNEVVLRDGHQSLFATRMRTDDMLPIAEKLDKVGYWALETWGGATFDACIRYLGEDPWERLRRLKKAMPNTRHQMLLRGQNILGYRHYADDVVQRFVERAAVNGMDVFRIFDAMNDVRNLQTAVKAAIDCEKHAQGTLSYTTSDIHTIQTWVTMAKQLEDMGCHSICIKDMAGLLTPFKAEELVTRLKETVELPIALHCHATTGLATSTILKAVEAGVDIVDTSISSMSMTYGHSPTEAVVAIFQGTQWDSELDMPLLQEIAAYFRQVRKKYAKFEGELRGIDSRILTAQVPGGMLTNMENQLREQNMADRMDDVLLEVPRVRADLGYIPLVTPTSQIVGTQAVLNVMTNERYKSITKETKGVLTGEYGATPAPVDTELQNRVVANGEHEVITVRPADLLPAEMDRLTGELQGLSQAKGMTLSEYESEDVLIHALFPQVGLKFLENRNNPDAFEPVPTGEEVTQPDNLPTPSDGNFGPEMYQVVVNGNSYSVEVSTGGEIRYIEPSTQASSSAQTPLVNTSEPSASNTGSGDPLPSPLAGNVFKVMVKEGQQVNADDVLIIMEAMKMETEIRSIRSGTVKRLAVREGDAVKPGEPLLYIG